MIELIAMIAVSAVALTFFSDTTRYAVKMVRPRNRGNVHVADRAHTEHAH
jgi:hypothetical protein